MTTTLTKQQRKTFGPRLIAGYAKGATITVTVRFDDECNNGHNTFAITAEVREPRRGIVSCGCLHDDVAKYFPELAPVLKWHLCSTDGPLHYIANTTYHVEKGKLDSARNSAIWPDATANDLKPAGLDDRLRERFPALMEEFRAAVESLGFTW